MGVEEHIVHQEMNENRYKTRTSLLGRDEMTSTNFADTKSLNEAKQSSGMM